MKDRTRDLTDGIDRTMEEDGFEKDQKKKSPGSNIKKEIAKNMVKGMLTG